MGVRESLLNTITSVADSDFVRIVTSAGASSKATVKNLFKGFESNLGAKSSLTTSDYIRVVGSDNEAYKQLVSDVAKKIIENYTGSSLAGSSQSVKNALDSLNSKTVINTSTQIISSTTLAYTGVSYTIPAKSFYAITFDAVFLNNAPQEILLSNSSSEYPPHRVYAHSVGGAKVSIAGTSDTAITIYVWAKYGGSSTNRIDIDGIIKSL